jgi:PTS system nitrogen regulatory IIA component
MDLRKALPPEAICFDLAADTKAQALEILCQQAARSLRLQTESIYFTVMERENLGSTAVGGGVALPHGKIPDLDRLFMILARTAPGKELDFDSPDGQPVRILALVLSSLTAASEHLQVLALLGRLWKTPENLRLLLSATDRETFYNIFMELAAINE